MSATTLAVGAGALLALIVGGKVAVDTVEEMGLRERLRQAAERLGIPAEWLFGMARIESNWNPDAVNNAGPDGARGGAWGLLQITLKTARSYGFAGEPEGLLDPATHIELAEVYISSRPGGVPRSLADLAAWWNAGRTSFNALPATSTARAYAAKLADAAEREA